jgi:SAM-dependent methyltransferase
VYSRLRTRCGLRAGARVLEVGPGTGLVTVRLLDAGASVVAVEPDPGLAAHLRGDVTGDLEVVAATFEDARLPEAGFDLAVAATSFHWVDQARGLAKLGRVVRPGGWVALWWTLFRDPGAADEFTRSVERILGPRTRGSFDEPGRPPFQLDEEHRCRDLRDLAGLTDVVAEVVTTDLALTTAQVRALYGSMATVLRRPVAERSRLLTAIGDLVDATYGGRVVRRFVTAFYRGRRPG